MGFIVQNNQLIRYEEEPGVLSVTIPKEVRCIRENAFRDCTGLRGVVFHHGLKSILHGAFSGCTSLRQLRIPDSVGYIGKAAFSGCKDLQTVHLPKGLKCIAEETFIHCASLLRVILPEALTRIEYRAFEKCESLTRLQLPDTLEYIGFAAFRKCEGLQGVTLPDSLRTLGSHAFTQCHGLKEVRLPAGLQNIQRYTFADCGQLARVIVPEGVTEIGAVAFHSCKALTGVSLPETLQKIGAMAFEYCEKLRHLTIPASVTNVKENAFRKTSWLRQQKGPFVIVGDGCLLAYRKPLKKAHCIHIPEGVRHIYSCVFQGLEIEELTFPDSLQGLCHAAFSHCRFLCDVTIPAHITELEPEPFYSCDMQKLTVAEEHPCFVMHEEALYDKALKRMIQFPYHLETVHLADTTETVCFTSMEMLGIHAPRNTRTIVFRGKTLYQRNIEGQLDVLVCRKLDTRLKLAVKLELIWQLFLWYPDDRKINAHIRQNLLGMVRFLIQRGDEQMIGLVLDRGFVTAGNIDWLIECAVRANQPGLLLMLMNYKNTHFGYDRLLKL